MMEVTFAVETSGGIQAYQLWVGEYAVEMTNDEGVIDLDENERHILFWWMLGNSGGKLHIVGTVEEGRQVVEVKGTRVPDGEREGAGYRRFVLAEDND